MSEGKNLGNFLLFIGLMFAGASVVYTGVTILLGGPGAPAYFLLPVIAIGIAMIISGALLARHYL